MTQTLITPPPVQVMRASVNVVPAGSYRYMTLDIPIGYSHLIEYFMGPKDGDFSNVSNDTFNGLVMGVSKVTSRSFAFYIRNVGTKDVKNVQLNAVFA